MAGEPGKIFLRAATTPIGITFGPTTLDPTHEANRWGVPRVQHASSVAGREPHGAQAGACARAAEARDVLVQLSRPSPRRFDVQGRPDLLTTVEGCLGPHRATPGRPTGAEAGLYLDRRRHIWIGSGSQHLSGRTKRLSAPHRRTDKRWPTVRFLQEGVQDRLARWISGIGVTEGTRTPDLQGHNLAL